MPSPAEEALPTPDPLEGTPFRTVRCLGKGGMGVVLEAAHRELGKHFVVKVLLNDLAADDRHVKRLRLEAKSLAKLDSPHVVGVSDLGQTPAGATYIAMELLHGRNLRAELAARPGAVIPVDEALVWARQMLAGLGAAHRLKIIHRDVKLDNLFVCDATESQPRRIKVLDFGIAKSLEDATSGQTAQPQTQEGVFLGTPRYVSPEQALCQPIDARSDIYSAGLVLYQLVAGKGPFARHKSALDLLTAQLSEEPQPPSSVARQALPLGLDAVILKAIAKDPDRRYQSAEEFSAALDAVDVRRVPTVAPQPAAPGLAELADTTIESATLVRPRSPSGPSPNPVLDGRASPTDRWQASDAQAQATAHSITGPLPDRRFEPGPGPSPRTESPTIVSPPRVAAPAEANAGVDVRRFVVMMAIAAIASLAVFSLLLHFYSAPR